MKVYVIGGGPAGPLLRDPDEEGRLGPRRHRVRAQPARTTPSAGASCSPTQTLGNFAAADPESYDAITDHFAHWDDIDVHFRGTHDHVGRARLLRHRAPDAARHPAGTGAERSASSSASSTRSTRRRRRTRDADLIVAADGVNSAHPRAIRRRIFEPDLDIRTARFIWLGTTRLFDAFTFIFVETRARRVPGARLPLRRDHVDVHRRVRRARPGSAAGFDRWTSTQTRRRAASACSRRGSTAIALLSNVRRICASIPWIRFARVRNAALVTTSNVVLIGDAAHTAHFSIGSGTKLAMEDAIALARALDERAATSPRALAAYEAERDRGAAAPERGAQLDGVVRERAPLHPPASRSSSPTAC